MKRIPSKCLTILKTMNLYLCFFTLGMCMAVPGPCLLDLQSIVNTDTQHIAFIYTARFIGYLAGAILGGILLDCTRSKQAVMTVFNFLMSSSMVVMPFSRSLGTLIGLMVINGFSIGTLDTGGILLDCTRSKQAVMTVFNFLMSSSMVVMPFSRSLGTLIGLMVINGFSIGTLDTGGNVLCLTLWKSESGPFFQALHFSFGVGSFVAPLIAAPYLASSNNVGDNATLPNYSTTTNNIEDSYLSTTENKTFFSFTNRFTNYSSEYLNLNRSDFQNSSSNIVYPFSMIGGFGLLVTIIFWGTAIVSPTERKTFQNRSSDDGDDAKSSVKFLLSVGVFNVLLLFLETGTEIGFAQMLTTYVVKGQLQLPASTGSYMTSAFWAAFTVSRLVAIFLAIKISSFTFILIDLSIALVGSIVLLFLSSYEWAMWAASIILGAGVASFFPAAIGWLNCYINVTNKVASIFIVGASLGGMIIPLTISYFIETFPDILIYVVPLTVVACCVVTLVLHLILRKKEKKRVKKEPEDIAFIATKVST